jgi:pyruvate/2-oxoglutarate dehydrogenase complex dihydrolipoamide acyltransferase (E2) component
VLHAAFAGDHRVSDGRTGARFLQRFADSIGDRVAALEGAQR